jgi:hypothetical protein
MKNAGRQYKIMIEHRRRDVINIRLTPEQLAEIKRRMSDHEPFATDKEVQATFARITKRRKVT